MDIEYYMKIQNTYGVNSRREKELVKTNLQLKNILKIHMTQMMFLLMESRAN